MERSSVRAAQACTAPSECAEIVVAGSRTTYRAHGDPQAQHLLVALHGLRGRHRGLVPVVAARWSSSPVRTQATG